MDSELLQAPVRGDATREALVRAAIDCFGMSGFSAVSTRAIARAAGVNQALIGYHFGGKTGLYRAALEHIAAELSERIGPQVEEIEALLSHAGSRPAGGADHLAALEQLMGTMAAMLTSERSAAWARLLLREQQDPSDAFDVVYERVMKRILAVVCGLVAAVRSADPESSETRLTAMAIVGQVLVYRAANAAVLRQLGWSEVGPAELAAIQEETRRNLRAMLARGEKE